jgi:hypothetical protein
LEISRPPHPPKAAGLRCIDIVPKRGGEGTLHPRNLLMQP